MKFQAAYTELLVLSPPHSFHCADVERLCLEMDEQQISLTAVEMLPLDDNMEGPQHVLWALLFSNSPVWQYPGTGSKFKSLEDKQEEVPQAPEETGTFVQINAATRAVDSLVFPKYMLEDDMSRFIYG
jgi:hypothetical protein